MQHRRCERTGVKLDENILLALVAVESEGEPEARSARGAVGLVQVEPSTFEDLRATAGNLLPRGPLSGRCQPDGGSALPGGVRARAWS